MYTLVSVHVAIILYIATLALCIEIGASPGKIPGGFPCSPRLLC